MLLIVMLAGQAAALGGAPRMSAVRGPALVRAAVYAMVADNDSNARRAERRERRKVKRGQAGPAPALADAGMPTAAPLPPPAVTIQMQPLPIAAPRPVATTSMGPATYDPASAAPFVQDSPGLPLPSFDDFRRRDEAAAGKRVPGFGFDAPAFSSRGSTPAPPRFDAPLGAASPGGTDPSGAERLMELLSFDTIDERPANEDPYDATARLIGRGLPNKAGAYLLPYLQTGHMLLLGVLLLSSSISYPGFPLTEVPEEYRALIHQGLAITYAFNAAAAIYCRGIAERKQQPVNFWSAKVLLLGGLALGELSEAVPEAPPPKKRQGRP